MNVYQKKWQTPINIIIKQAHINIDTRLKLRVKPSKLKNYELLVEKLNTIHNRDLLGHKHIELQKMNNGCDCPLDGFRSHFINSGGRSVDVNFAFWFLDDFLRYNRKHI